MKMPALVLYHANCTDGFCSAWVAKLFLRQAEFVPVQYGRPVPDVLNREVYILDFSYPRAVLEKMRLEATSLVVLDHHKTAAEDLRGLDYCVFDMDHSGAMLTWRYFFGGSNPPRVVKYVEDRDLWLFRLPESRAYSAALASYDFDFEVWDRLRYDDVGLFAEGQAILRYQEQLVNIANLSAGRLVIGGHNVRCTNATNLISETCGKLAEGELFAATWFEEANGDRVYSLRSPTDGLDVSKIAKLYGGGGHAHAAGFRIKSGETLVHNPSDGQEALCEPTASL